MFDRRTDKFELKYFPSQENSTNSVVRLSSLLLIRIYAKPIIDLLIEVRDINQVDAQSQVMQALGYEVKGEFGMLGRRYFRKDNQQGIRTHQIHTFETGSTQVERHLAFRDYLIAQPVAAQKYSELKRKLAKKHSDNMDGYIDGKDDFIKETDRRAAQWRASKKG